MFLLALDISDMGLFEQMRADFSRRSPCYFPVSKVLVDFNIFRRRRRVFDW
jgi:hypothetical protein